MKAKYLLFAAVLNLVLLAGVSPLHADTLKMKDGRTIEGTVTKIENCKVYVEIKNEAKVLDMMDVETMQFAKTESQEIARTVQQVDQASLEIRQLLAKIDAAWTPRQPIDAKDEPAWAAAKEEFSNPLMAYQEVLNELYFQVLARMDEYNKLVKQAEDIYVGIKGVRIGSALVNPDTELPLRKYVPSLWYETIFQEGYNLGFADASAHSGMPTYNNRR
jgi:outer membrane murein-binding lipoprotein Lpp